MLQVPNGVKGRPEHPTLLFTNWSIDVRAVPAAVERAKPVRR
jgi:hypothetical protein